MRPARLAEEHFYRALCERPPHEAPMEALCCAVPGAWEGISETIEQVIPVELHLRTFRMIERAPVLLAVNLRRSEQLEERLAREIARREGIDVATDPRPRIAVAAFGGVM